METRDENSEMKTGNESPEMEIRRWKPVDENPGYDKTAIKNRI
jgi:hypothetical protein